MKQQRPILLSDEQVQRYIADGFLIVNSNLDPAFHAAVSKALDFTLTNELPHPGDNIVPRIPALDKVCESPVVRGALISLLGNQYALAPHRFPHNSEPLDKEADTEFEPFDNQPKMGRGSISGSGWHQDGHSRSGRSRWHTSRVANVFYFPHDTPVSMGPTRLLAGSHLYATLRGTSSGQVVLQSIPAGSVVICHFDLGHAGTPNLSDRSRYMVKFVALRTQNPSTPTWDCQDPVWHTPDDLKTPDDIPVVWTSLWNWMRGVDRNEGITVPSIKELPRLMDGILSKSQEQRLSCLYDLISVGAPAVDGLVESLLETAGLGRHQSPESTDQGYYAMSPNVLERRFSERQFVPEDAAIGLAAIGTPAVPKLVELLAHEDPWIRINAAYALGDAGPKAAGAQVDDIGGLLNDQIDSVIRVALDSLCALGTFGPVTVKRLHRFLTEDYANWEEKVDSEPQVGWYWTLQNQIRYQSSLALLAWVSNSDEPSADVEEALIDALDDVTGYTPAMACLALERLNSVSAMRAAIRYLSVRRLDATLDNSISQPGGIVKVHRKVMLARLNREEL